MKPVEHQRIGVFFHPTGVDVLLELRQNGQHQRGIPTVLNQKEGRVGGGIAESLDIDPANLRNETPRVLCVPRYICRESKITLNRGGWPLSGSRLQPGWHIPAR